MTGSTPDGRKRRRNKNEMSKPDNTHWIPLDFKRKTKKQKSEFGVETPHYEKSNKAYRFMKKHCVGTIDSKAFPNNMSEDDIYEWLKAYLEGIKKEGDEKKVKESAVVFYLECEGAGYNGKKWKFVFTHHGYREINAHKFCQIMVDSQVPCMLILDGHISDRFRDMWKPPKGQTCHFEIIARGQIAVVLNGVRDWDPEEDFSTCLWESLNHVVEHINVRSKEGGCKGWKKPFSIPNLLAHRKMMSYNTFHKFIKSRGKPGTMPIERFLFHPVLIRRTGKLQLVRSRIKGPNKKSKLRIPKDKEPNDFDHVELRTAEDEDDSDDYDSDDEDQSEDENGDGDEDEDGLVHISSPYVPNPLFVGDDDDDADSAIDVGEYAILSKNLHSGSPPPQ